MQPGGHVRSSRTHSSGSGHTPASVPSAKQTFWQLPSPNGAASVTTRPSEVRPSEALASVRGLSSSHPLQPPPRTATTSAAGTRSPLAARSWFLGRPLNAFILVRLPLDRAAWSSSTDGVAAFGARSIGRGAVETIHVIGRAVELALCRARKAVRAARAARGARALFRNADERIRTHAGVRAVRKADHRAAAIARVGLWLVAATPEDGDDQCGGHAQRLRHHTSLRPSDRGRAGTRGLVLARTTRSC